MTLVEMCSHLATERAGMGTLHLTVGASELYPNPNGNGEQWIGRTYGARRQSLTLPLMQVHTMGDIVGVANEADSKSSNGGSWSDFGLVANQHRAGHLPRISA